MDKPKPNPNPNPAVMAVLEYGPIAAFLLAYFVMKNQSFTVFGQSYSGFIAATAVFVPLMIIATALQYWLSGKLSQMQLLTLVLVIVMGGLSIWLNDERFFKMKPTLIYLVFAAILGGGLLRGKALLQPLMGSVLPMRDEGWMVLTRHMTGLFLALALINETVWRLFSSETWVLFKTIGLPAIMFVFFMAHMKLFERYAIEKEADRSPD